MSLKKWASLIIIFILVLFLNIFVVKFQTPINNDCIQLEIEVSSDKEDGFQLFYEVGETDFRPENSLLVNYQTVGKKQKLTYSIPANVDAIRFDLGVGKSNTSIYGMKILYKSAEKIVDFENINDVDSDNGVLYEIENNSIQVRTYGNDPYMIWKCGTWKIADIVRQENIIRTSILKGIVCFFIDIFVLIGLKHYKKLISLPLELVQNRKLIFSLAKNDFKTRFAGSYLGVIWAFVQPIVTVLVYWFVFEKGLRAGGISTKDGISVPFVLWLIAGLVPWFFFQDAINGATNVLVEYSYLVKQVVFKISILPIVKMISALFVNLFFIAFSIFLFTAYQYYPDVYTLQIVYYMLAMFVFVLGVSYATCALVVFFRDLTQIIGIILQIQIWMTPIMWNIEGMDLSPGLITIFKLNPMYYIVTGFRNSLIDKVWFWEDPVLTAYYWLISVGMLGLGMLIFKRLKVHFADVL